VPSRHPPGFPPVVSGRCRGERLGAFHRPLKEAGVDHRRIYTDKVSGSRAERPGLEKCLAALDEGDVLVVYKLDRLGRSLGLLVDLVEDLQKRGVDLKSLQDGIIDTTTASGKLIFGIFGVAHLDPSWSA
jgi:DNA invertase Pin-like site-specific DNA recombinase